MTQKQSNTVAANTYEMLKHDIIFGKLSPGKKLKLQYLKQEYSASVSILRETLNKLACEGFVSAEEQRGFFVASVSEKKFRDIADLRVLLEGYALKLSIEKGDTEWESRVVAAHYKLNSVEQRLKQDDESEKILWKQYDMEFHQALISACDSQILLSLHSTVYNKYLRYQMLALTFRGDETKEHRQLLETVLARDVSGAQSALERHIHKGNLLPEFISKLD